MLVILCGPSCAGKTEIQKELLKRGYCEMISHTTRKPRNGEVNGKDYYFVSEEEFLKMKSDDNFAETDKYADIYYGTSIDEVKKAISSGKDYVAVVTPSGVRALTKIAGKENCFSVLVTASAAARVRRYINRAGDAFDVDDFKRLVDRIDTDKTLFHGIDNYVNLVLDNSVDNPEDIIKYTDELESKFKK